MLLIGSLLGGLWFLLFVAAHVGTFATRPIKNRSAVILLLFGLAILGAVLSSTFVPADIIPGVEPTSHRAMSPLAALLVMACCFVLYMPFYYTIATSLSVQTVIAIDDAPGHQMALAALAAPEVYEKIIAGRLVSMVQASNLVSDGYRYRATPKGQRTARIFGTLKEVWRLGPGG